MPRDSSGNYTLPVNSVDPAVFNTTISDVDFNATMNDIGGTLTASWDRNGNGAALAALDMGAFRLKNLGVPTTAGDAVRFGDAIPGLVAGSFPGAGKVGQVISASPAGVGLSNATATTIGSVAVGAGNWFLFLQPRGTVAGGTSVQQISACISSANNAFTVLGDARCDAVPFQSTNWTFWMAGLHCIVSPTVTTTYYYVGQMNSTGATTLSMGGTLTALRVS